MEEKKKLKIVSIISFFVIAIIGTLLHFIYEFSLENKFVGSFSAVNESVFEHLKILVMPMFLVSIYEFIIFKSRKYNLFVALLFRIIAGIVFVILVFYTYTHIIGKNIAIVDILTFYIAILISQIIWYIVLVKCSFSKNISIISLIISLSMFVLFVIFTYFPPKLELFRDSTNSTYGIFNEK